MTTGRRPQRWASRIEPTPAWATTTRARSIVRAHVRRRAGTPPTCRGRPGCARTRTGRRAPRRPASSRAARARRSKPCSFVPVVTKIMPPRRGCRPRSARRPPTPQLGPLDEDLAGHGLDEAPGEREAVDAGHALDVDDRDAGHARPARRRGRRRRRPVETIAQGRSAGQQAAGQAQVAQEVGDVAVRRPVGVDDALALQQRAGVGLVEGHPEALVGPRTRPAARRAAAGGRRRSTPSSSGPRCGGAVAGQPGHVTIVPPREALSPAIRLGRGLGGRVSAPTRRGGRARAACTSARTSGARQAHSGR